uniref:ATP synthase subunit a n=1 Tax=Trichopria drosophilae TaxID=1507179 RepID=A0A6M3HR29_9HYME|nr:ATP synthase F0 subunit 6 [Trichopria drosophilae]QIV21185.1 ATP synthase F0 subunit 6 [Trichopria drosophilae]
MMLNLFSIFDPSTSMNFSLNWISMIYVLMFLPNLYWLMPSRYNMFILMIMKFLFNEFKVLMMKKMNYMNLFMYISLFFMILLNNFMGMFPYIFTSSSQMLMSLSYSLSLWIMYMLFGWIKNTNYMFIHLMPIGTPNILMPFMVMIESISNIIRPMTLSIRLTANIISGHLLMTLISMNANNLLMYMLLLMLMIQSLLMILELSVSIIQSYVFSILNILYLSETN